MRSVQLPKAKKLSEDEPGGQKSASGRLIASTRWPTPGRRQRVKKYGDKKGKYTQPQAKCDKRQHDLGFPPGLCHSNLRGRPALKPIADAERDQA